MSAATATALRVLASAVERGYVVDRPSCADIAGRQLQPIEVYWLADGMPDATLGPIPDARQGEDMQLIGTLLGRVVRVRFFGRDQAGLIGTLRQKLDRRRAEASAR